MQEVTEKKFFFSHFFQDINFCLPAMLRIEAIFFSLSLTFFL